GGGAGLRVAVALGPPVFAVRAPGAAGAGVLDDAGLGRHAHVPGGHRADGLADHVPPPVAARAAGRHGGRALGRAAGGGAAGRLGGRGRGGPGGGPGAWGPPPRPAPERIERLGEAAAVIKALLGGEPASFAGRYYSLEAAVAHPRPARRPPLLIAGGG